MVGILGSVTNKLLDDVLGFDPGGGGVYDFLGVDKNNNTTQTPTAPNPLAGLQNYQRQNVWDTSGEHPRLTSGGTGYTFAPSAPVGAPGGLLSGLPPLQPYTPTTPTPQPAPEAPVKPFPVITPGPTVPDDDNKPPYMPPGPSDPGATPRDYNQPITKNIIDLADKIGIPTDKLTPGMVDRLHSTINKGIDAVTGLPFGIASTLVNPKIVSTPWGTDFNTGGGGIIGVGGNASLRNLTNIYNKALDEHAPTGETDPNYLQEAFGGGAVDLSGTPDSKNRFFTPGSLPTVATSGNLDGTVNTPIAVSEGFIPGTRVVSGNTDLLPPQVDANQDGIISATEIDALADPNSAVAQQVAAINANKAAANQQLQDSTGGNLGQARAVTDSQGKAVTDSQGNIVASGVTAEELNKARRAEAGLTTPDTGGGILDTITDAASGVVDKVKDFTGLGQQPEVAPEVTTPVAPAEPTYNWSNVAGGVEADYSAGKYRAGDKIFDNWTDARNQASANDAGIGYNADTDKFSVGDREFTSSHNASNYNKSLTDDSKAYAIGDGDYSFKGQVYDNFQDAYRSKQASDKGFGYNPSTDKFSVDGKEFDSSFYADQYNKSKTDTSKYYSIGNGKYSFSGKEYDNYKDAAAAEREHNATWENRDHLDPDIQVRQGATARYRVGDKEFDNYLEASNYDRFNDAIAGKIPADDWRHSSYSGGTYLGDINGDGQSDYFKNGKIYSGITNTRTNSNPIGSTTGNVTINYDGSFSAAGVDGTFANASQAQQAFHNSPAQVQARIAATKAAADAAKKKLADARAGSGSEHTITVPAHSNEDFDVPAQTYYRVYNADGTPTNEFITTPTSKPTPPSQQPHYQQDDNDDHHSTGIGVDWNDVNQVSDWASGIDDWSYGAYGGKVNKGSIGYAMGGKIRKKNCDWSV